jgi:chromosome segregation ATPase
MSVIDVDSSVADGVGNAPRVDVSSDSLSIGSLHSSVEAAESAAPAQTRPLAISMSSMPRRRFVGSNLGSKIVQVGSVLGHSVLAAATVVSQSAERIMDTAIPMYSEEQMDDIMNKKDTLLRELSQTCMMLGVSEQKQRDLEDQLNMLRHTEERAEDSRRLAEERYRLACSRFEEASLELAAVQADRDAWSARAHAAETEMEDMRAKVRSCKDTIASLKSELESSKSLLHSTTIEKAKIESSLLETERNNRDMHLIVAEIKADLESERSAHIADTSSWNMQFDRMDEEQQKLREELKLALDEAASRFKAIEGQRDDALKECDILKELMETYRVAHDAEMSRMKENVNAQQQWQKERLKERDDEINRLRRELEILNSRSNELSEQLAVRSTENTDLSQRLLRAEAETAVVTHAARSLESKLTELAEEKQGIEASMKSSISEKNTEIVRLRDEVFKAQSATLSASENADRLKSNLFEVESALRAAEEKNHSLHEKLRHARAEGEESNENWKQVISLLRVQMEERETELRNAMQCVQESARIQAEELRASVNELSMQLADNKQSEERLQDELLSYKQFFESVLREIKVDVQMSNDFDFVIGLISAKVSAVVESQLILAEKESNIAESNKKIVSLMSELGQVNSELMTAKLKTATLNRDHSVTVNSLMEEVGRLNAELVGHRTAETELRADLDKCKLELHSVTNQYTSTKNEYESIQILIRNKTNELELIRRNYAEEIELLNARVNSRELSNNEMICQLEAKERLIFELQQSNEGLSQNVAQATKDLASSESAVAKAMEELQQTAVKLQYSCNENQKLRDACDEKVRSLELKIGEMARLTLANDALQLQLDQFKSSLKLAESEVVSLKSSLQGKDSAIEKLRAEIKSLEEKEAFLSSQLEAASESQREEKHLHERSIATLTRSIDILTAKLNASERNNKRLKDDIASLSEQYNSSISAAAELELKLIESSNKTMANPSESSLISDKFKKFVEKIAKLEEVLSQEQERNFKLSSDLSETNFEVMRLQESIAENQSSFALQIDDANNKISALRKTTESMESELNGKSEDLAVASANISKLQDVINKKDESIDLLNKVTFRADCVHGLNANFLISFVQTEPFRRSRKIPSRIQQNQASVQRRDFFCSLRNGRSEGLCG